MKYNRAQLNPSKHSEIIADYETATPEQINAAADAALKAKLEWEATPFGDRAAELAMGKNGPEIVAATMLGQGKNIWQAEIDAPAETVDFFRRYVQEAWSLFFQQPRVQPAGQLNKKEDRLLGIEGKRLQISLG